jgi:hypothetical protein
MSTVVDATDVSLVNEFLQHSLQHLTVDSSDCDSEFEGFSTYRYPPFFAVTLLVVALSSSEFPEGAFELPSTYPNFSFRSSYRYKDGFIDRLA